MSFFGISESKYLSEHIKTGLAGQKETMCNSAPKDARRGQMHHPYNIFNNFDFLNK